MDRDNPKHYEAFTTELAILAEVFGEQMSEVRLRAYFEDLADWSLEHVLLGIRHARKTLKFFPKPAELRQACAAEREAIYDERLAEDTQHYLGAGPDLPRLSGTASLKALMPRRE